MTTRASAVHKYLKMWFKDINRLLLTKMVRENREKIFVVKDNKKIAKKKKNARRFYTLYKQKFANLRPLLSITFLQEFRKSKHFGHWTSGSKGKKRLNGVNK